MVKSTRRKQTTKRRISRSGIKTKVERTIEKLRKELIGKCRQYNQDIIRVIDIGYTLKPNKSYYVKCSWVSHYISLKGNMDSFHFGTMEIGLDCFETCTSVKEELFKCRLDVVQEGLHRVSERRLYEIE